MITALIIVGILIVICTITLFIVLRKIDKMFENRFSKEIDLSDIDDSIFKPLNQNTIEL